MNHIMQAVDIDKALTRIAHEILENHQKSHTQDFPIIVGIRTRGEFLAKRLIEKISVILSESSSEESHSKGHGPDAFSPKLGILDINLYRDDLTLVQEQPIVKETIMDFDIDGSTLILVDDVLYTGRTTRAAMDAVTDLGRPKRIQLVVLIDRGHRELPIRADYVGKNIPTTDKDIVHVKLNEVDGVDEVVLD